MIKNKPAKKNENKLRTAGLSVFLAVIVWFMVIYINDPDITTTVSNLEVRFTGEAALREKGLALTGKDEIGALSAVVRGKRSDLMEYMNDIYVQVDVNELDKTGEYELTGKISAPVSISVEKDNNGKIPVRVESLTSKDIEVRIKQIGTIKNKLVETVVNNPTVTITGAKSEIDNVAGAVATVDITKIDADKTEKTTYLLTDKNDALIDENETIEANRSYVEISNNVYDTRTLTVVPMLTADMDNDYILKTDKSTVTPATVIVGVTEGNTDDKVIARIDRLYEDGTGEYMLESTNGMYIPESVRTVKIKADVVKKTTQQIEFTVEAENVSEGMSVRIDDKLNAWVWGEEGKDLAENARAVVNVSGLEKGKHTLPVKLHGDNIGFTESYEINVTIE